MTDKEILDYCVDQSGNTVRNLGSISYMAWVAKKLDGAPTYRAATQELMALIRTPSLGVMPEEEKLKVFRKLLELELIP